MKKFSHFALISASIFLAHPVLAQSNQYGVNTTLNAVDTRTLSYDNKVFAQTMTDYVKVSVDKKGMLHVKSPLIFTNPEQKPVASDITLNFSNSEKMTIHVTESGKISQDLPVSVGSGDYLVNFTAPPKWVGTKLVLNIPIQTLNELTTKETVEAKNLNEEAINEVSKEDTMIFGGMAAIGGLLSMALWLSRNKKEKPQNVPIQLDKKIEPYMATHKIGF